MFSSISRSLHMQKYNTQAKWCHIFIIIVPTIFSLQKTAVDLLLWIVCVWADIRKTRQLKTWIFPTNSVLDIQLVIGPIMDSNTKKHTKTTKEKTDEISSFWERIRLVNQHQLIKCFCPSYKWSLADWLFRMDSALLE